MNKKVTDKDIQEVKKWAAKGLHNNDISEITGWSESTIRRIRNDRLEEHKQKMKDFREERKEKRQEEKKSILCNQKQLKFSADAIRNEIINIQISLHNIESHLKVLEQESGENR